MNKKGFVVLLCTILCFFGVLTYAEEAQKTQGEFAVQLCKALGLEVPQGDYIEQLDANGITPEGGWQKEKPMTNTEMANMLAKALGLEKEIESRVEQKVEEAYRDKATIVKITGKVDVKLGKTGDWAPAEEGMKLTQADSIRTGPGSWADIRVGMVGGIKVKENSEIKLSELSSNPDGTENIILYMTIGDMLVDVRGLQKGSSFQVNTVTTVAAVRGTIYNVKVVGETTEVKQAE